MNKPLISSPLGVEHTISGDERSANPTRIRVQRERPILMSAPMILALLAGRKTQTRRIVKPAPPAEFWDHKGYELRPQPDGFYRFHFKDSGEVATYSPTVRCPYGVPRDRLWCKETFHYDNLAYVAKYKASPWLGLPDAGNAGTYYRASEANHDIFPRWRPSIFMPRWASRITLEITSVRVERLNSISEEDAEAEGVERNEPIPASAWTREDGWLTYPVIPASEDFPAWSAKESFETLWTSINGAGSWAKNPWVWVLSFRRLT